MEGINIQRIYIGFLVLIVFATAGWLAYRGYAYYSLKIEDRFFSPDHELLKSSGTLGHGLGIIGSLMMLVGVSTYMLRKRIRRFSRLGILKHWLEFHIFLCTLGPILVLFHTSFKFGGLVAVSFWSMVAVVLSGVVGRYIYLQIPHTIEGREMNLSEIDQVKQNLNQQLTQAYSAQPEVLDSILNAVKNRPNRSEKGMVVRTILKFRFERKTIRDIRKILREHKITGKKTREIMQLIRTEIKLNRKIDRLVSMQNLFKYWHVAHLPFALMMLIIMVIHVVVTITFGYRWIF